MSVKAMGLVWDLGCPGSYNGHEFKASHKFLLMGYADHADHNGKNIYPAVSTMARKTGMDERTVQRLTADLSAMGLLVDDGQGPKGTNRWCLPYNGGGDKLSPLTNCRGDKNPESLGDIPSGDIPSGDNLSPELNKPEPEDSSSEFVLLQKVGEACWPKEFETRRKFEKVISSCHITLSDKHLTLSGFSKRQADIYQDRYAKTLSRALVGFLSRTIDVTFEGTTEA